MEFSLILTTIIYVLLIILILLLIVFILKLFPILKELRILIEDVKKKTNSLSPIFDVVENVGNTFSKVGEAISSGLSNVVNLFGRKEK